MDRIRADQVTKLKEVLERDFVGSPKSFDLLTGRVELGIEFEGVLLGHVVFEVLSNEYVVLGTISPFTVTKFTAVKIKRADGEVFELTSPTTVFTSNPMYDAFFSSPDLVSSSPPTNFETLLSCIHEDGHARDFVLKPFTSEEVEAFTAIQEEEGSVTLGQALLVISREVTARIHELNTAGKIVDFLCPENSFLREAFSFSVLQAHLSYVRHCYEQVTGVSDTFEYHFRHGGGKI